MVAAATVPEADLPPKLLVKHSDGGVTGQALLGWRAQREPWAHLEDHGTREPRGKQPPPGHHKGPGEPPGVCGGRAPRHDAGCQGPLPLHILPFKGTWGAPGAPRDRREASA